jgi:hypothetical protein
MNISFIDLEIAYDTTLREMTMGTPRWMVVPEEGLRMVEATYEDTRSRVLFRPEMSGRFKVNVGLRPGAP